MSTHTPGPWTANLHHRPPDYAGRSHAMITAAQPLVPLAAVVLAAEGRDESEGIANARLIAAAPDMLVLLKELWAQPRVVSHSERPSEDWLLRARAAIAKAEPPAPKQPGAT